MVYTIYNLIVDSIYNLAAGGPGSLDGASQETLYLGQHTQGTLHIPSYCADIKALVLVAYICLVALT